VLFHGFPSLSVVQLHPIVFSIFDFSCVLESLGEQIPKVVVVRCILETEVPHVAQVFVELLCN